jgi:drug/metabolite transporter (DMT)-like permease
LGVKRIQISSHKLDRTSRFGILAALLGSALFTLMAYFVNQSKVVVAGQDLLAGRAIGGILILGFIYRNEIPSLFAKKAASVWFRSLFGALSVAAYFWNLGNTSIGTATVLADLAPVLVVLTASVLYNVKLDRLAILGSFISLAGVIILSSPVFSEMSPAVVVVGVSGAVAGTMAYFSLKNATKEFSSGVIVWAFSIGLLGVSLCCRPIGLLHLKMPAYLPLLIVTFAGLAAQIFMTLSYKYLSTQLASCLSLMACVWAVFLDLFVLHVILTPFALIAIVLIMVGIFLVQFSRTRIMTPNV